MAHSRYRFISWHEGLQKWVAQVKRRKKTWYKAFSEEVDAIDFVVRMTGRSKLALLRQPPRGRAMLSRYRGVAGTEAIKSGYSMLARHWELKSMRPQSCLGVLE